MIPSAKPVKIKAGINQKRLSARKYESGTNIPMNAPIRNIFFLFILSDNQPVVKEDIAVNARLRLVKSPSWVPVAPRATINMEL